VWHNFHQRFVAFAGLGFARGKDSLSAVSGNIAVVTLNGLDYTLASITGGKVQLPTGSYTVGVEYGTKKALLAELQTEWSWEPTYPFSARMPMFTGILNQAQIVWLLQRASVSWIESDRAITLAERSESENHKSSPSSTRAVGVSINGKVYTLAAIQNGVEIPKGSYVVGVKQGSKKALLSAMKAEWSWTPTLNMNNFPMFAGILDQKQLVWLLQEDDVRFIENDSMVTIGASADSDHDDEVDALMSSLGVMVSREWYTKAEVDSGFVQLPKCDYTVQVRLSAKQAILSQMYILWGWVPEVAFSDRQPLFFGLLGEPQIKWLLGLGDVRFISTKCGVVGEALHTSGHAAVMLVNGEVQTETAIRSNKIQLTTGNYIVGVREGVEKATLAGLRQKWALRPMAASEGLLLTGVLNHSQLLSLLRQQEVSFIEQGAQEAIASGAAASPSAEEAAPAGPAQQKAFLAGSAQR